MDGARVIDNSCSEVGHDVDEHGASCRRCGERAPEGFRLLERRWNVSPYSLFLDGLGDLGRRGVWYVNAPRRGFVVASWSYEDIVACSDAIEDQDSNSVTMVPPPPVAVAAGGE